MRILLAGSTGLIGTALTKHLQNLGHETSSLVRRMPQNKNEYYWDPENNTINLTALKNVDAIVNLAGASITKHHWTKKYKETIFTSRIKTTQTLVNAIQKTDVAPKCFINASAIGIYGNRPNETLTETSQPGTGFLSQVCANWENTAMQAANTTRTTTIRTGLVLNQLGGRLKKLLPILKWNVGMKPGDEQQWLSWITLADEIRAIEFLLTNETISGPVNLVSPHATEMQAFVAAFKEKIQSKTLFNLPKKMLDVTLGQMAKEVVFSSQNVQPQVLTQAGFTYTHPDLDSLINWVLAEKNLQD